MLYLLANDYLIFVDFELSGDPNRSPEAQQITIPGRT